MKTILIIISLVLLSSCATRHKQHLEFDGFIVEQGVYKPKPGWKFTPNDDGTFAVAKADDSSDSGGSIEPCDCALTTGGSCDQATVEDDFGDITEIWCISNGCGFCVGGTTEEPGGIDSSSGTIKFRLECQNNRVARQ